MTKPIRAMATERESANIRTLNVVHSDAESLADGCCKRLSSSGWNESTQKLNAFITVLADQAWDRARLAASDSRLVSAPRLTCF